MSQSQLEKFERQLWKWAKEKGMRVQTKKLDPLNGKF